MCGGREPSWSGAGPTSILPRPLLHWCTVRAGSTELVIVPGISQGCVPRPFMPCFSCAREGCVEAESQAGAVQDPPASVPRPLLHWCTVRAGSTE